MARPNQPGYGLEVKAFEYLKEKVPMMNWQHLNGKHVFDIISDTHAIDVVSVDHDGDLQTEHKNMMRHIATANKKGQIPYLMFPWRKTWEFKKIDVLLVQRHKGEKIDTYKMKVLTIDNLSII